MSEISFEALVESSAYAAKAQDRYELAAFDASLEFDVSRCQKDMKRVINHLLGEFAMHTLLLVSFEQSSADLNDIPKMDDIMVQRLEWINQLISASEREPESNRDIVMLNREQVQIDNSIVKEFEQRTVDDAYILERDQKPKQKKADVGAPLHLLVNGTASEKGNAILHALLNQLIEIAEDPNATMKVITALFTICAAFVLASSRRTPASPSRDVYKSLKQQLGKYAFGMSVVTYVCFVYGCYQGYENLQFIQRATSEAFAVTEEQRAQQYRVTKWFSAVFVGSVSNINSVPGFISTLVLFLSVSGIWFALTWVMVASTDESGVNFGINAAIADERMDIEKLRAKLMEMRTLQIQSLTGKNTSLNWANLTETIESAEQTLAQKVSALNSKFEKERVNELQQNELSQSWFKYIVGAFFRRNVDLTNSTIVQTYTLQTQNINSNSSTSEQTSSQSLLTYEDFANLPSRREREAYKRPRLILEEIAD